LESSMSDHSGRNLSRRSLRSQVNTHPRLRASTCPRLTSSITFDHATGKPKAQSGCWSTQYRQSLVRPTQLAHGRARTPPSAFPFLLSTVSKSHSARPESRKPEPPWNQMSPWESNPSMTV